MWVKICGNTNLEDAAVAADLGADAVGFVFAESKRQVTAAQVAAIAPHLPPGVERVGVFCRHSADEIAETVRQAGLTAVQLHGGLDNGLSERLAEKFAGTVRMIQTLHWHVTLKDNVGHLVRQIEHIAAAGITDRILIDSKVGAATGGTGVSFDWAAAQSVFASASAGMRLILAGGLKPDNLAQALAQLHPWGVDVASGVEESPGRKDPALVKRFIAIAHGAKTP